MIDFDLLLRIISASGIITLVGLWWRRDVALRKLSSTEAGDLRDHYAAELQRYIEEIDRISTRQLACEGREEKLRGRVRHLEDEVAGLHRQIARYSSDSLLILEDKDRAPEATASAERVKDIIREKE